MDYEGLYRDVLQVHGRVLFAIAEYNGGTYKLERLQAFEYECRCFLGELLRQMR